MEKNLKLFIELFVIVVIPSIRQFSSTQNTQILRIFSSIFDPS